MMTNLKWLATRTLQTVHHDDETDEWVFDFGEGYVLQVASPWRFTHGGAIKLGDCDHEQKFGGPHPVDAASVAGELVAGHVVVEAVVSDGSSDLKIDFGGGLHFEVFSNSSGYENWILNAPGNRIVVSLGGGKLDGPRCLTTG